MGACPFCKGAVDEEILQFGGRCPSCLIEIPGEEAPTNPGEAAKAEQEAAVKGPRVGIIAVIVGGVIAVAGGGYLAMSPEPHPSELAASGSDAYKNVSQKYLVIDLDDEPATEEGDAVADAAPTAKKKPKTASASAKKSATPKATPALTPAATPGLLGDDDLGEIDVAVADAGPSTREGSARAPEASRELPTTDAGMVPKLGSGGSGADPMAVAVAGGPRGRLEAVEVCGDGIRDVVKGRMSQLGKRLTRCADKMVKQDEGFRAVVKVNVSIETSGKISRVDMRPSGSDDAVFLQCLETTIRATGFPRFCEPLDLSKTYYFGSQR